LKFNTYNIHTKQQIINKYRKKRTRKRAKNGKIAIKRRQKQAKERTPNDC